MKTIIFISLLLVHHLLPAQDVNEIIREAGHLESSMKDELALIKYKEALQTQPGNIFALCKASELCSRVGVRYKENKLMRADFFAAAKTYAIAALKFDSLNSESNFVMALVMGREAMERGGKEKIMAVKSIKHYADLSIRYNPQNFKAWFILGKWYYEVSSLNYFERLAVKLFFGALPDAHIDDAIRCLEKSKSLNPGFVLNYLSLAKAYKRKDDDTMAKQNLVMMISLPDKTEDDAQIKSEGRVLLKKWN